MGEYGGFYFARLRAPREFEGAPGYFLAEYLEALCAHARGFAESTATANGCDYYLDHCPWNLLVGGDLHKDVPDALYVLMLRHPVGVVESLGRSFAASYRWAGKDVAARAGLWRRCYEKALELPEDRTVAVSYDALCAAPETTLCELEDQVKAKGFPLGSLDRSVLAVSHAATAADKRPTLVRAEGENGSGFAPIPVEHDPALQEEIAPMTAPLQNRLASRFGCDWVR
jgi:hypothetical protein